MTNTATAYDLFWLCLRVEFHPHQLSLDQGSSFTSQSESTRKPCATASWILRSVCGVGGRIGGARDALHWYDDAVQLEDAGDGRATQVWMPHMVCDDTSLANACVLYNTGPVHHDNVRTHTTDRRALQQSCLLLKFRKSIECSGKYRCAVNGLATCC